MVILSYHLPFVQKLILVPSTVSWRHARHWHAKPNPAQNNHQKTKLDRHIVRPWQQKKKKKNRILRSVVETPFLFPPPNRHFIFDDRHMKWNDLVLRFFTQ